jgi:thiamine biosynthesis protein ThiS
MNLTLNGSTATLDGPITITELLARHKLKPETVVVEYNLRVPAKHEYDLITLADGDRVEIVKFMGGG